jgi:hypothetical protein
MSHCRLYLVKYADTQGMLKDCVQRGGSWDSLRGDKLYRINSYQKITIVNVKTSPSGGHLVINDVG